MGEGREFQRIRSSPATAAGDSAQLHRPSSVRGSIARPAGSGLPLADLAWTQPLSAETVAKAAVRCCLDGADDISVKGKESGDAVVIKVQEMAEMKA